MQQLKVAFGLARKNVCLSRLRNVNRKAGKEDPELKVGDLVTLRDHSATKGKSPWRIGYKVTKFVGERTVQIEHIETGKRCRVSVSHLKKAEPLSILLENSQVDLFPGGTKLFLSAEDLVDLNWPATGGNQPVGDELMNKLREAVRDRSSDSQPQLGNHESSGYNDGSRYVTRSGRVSKPNRKSGYVYAASPLLVSNQSELESHESVCIVDISEPIWIPPKRRRQR